MHARRLRQLVTVTIAVIVIDLASKLAAVVANGRRHGAIVPAHNPKLSLGIAGASAPIEVGLMLLGVMMVTPLLLLQLRRGRLPGWIAGLVIGGAAANLLDRAATGAVHDFLATPWVLLNVADIAVFVGVIGTAFMSLRREDSAQHRVMSRA